MSHAGPLMDHFRRPRNAGRFARSEEGVVQADVGGRRQGVAVRLQLKLDDAGRIAAARFKAHGAVAVIAGASLLTEWLAGCSLDEAAAIRGLELARALELPPERTGDVLWVEDALHAAIDAARHRCAGD